VRGYSESNRTSLSNYISLSESIFHLEVYIFKRRWYRSVVRHTGIALYHHNTEQWWIHEVDLSGARTKLTTKEELTAKERYITKACDIISSLEKIRSILFDYTWSYRFSTNNCRDHVRFVLERLKTELNIEILPEAEQWIKRIQLKDNVIAFVVGQMALNGLGVSFPVSAAVTGSILLAKELRKKSLPSLKKVILDRMNGASTNKNFSDRLHEEIGIEDDRPNTAVNVNDTSRFKKIISLIRHKLK
jgi:hypothetical protein